MAISGITARGSQVSNSNGTTVSMNPTATLTVGKYLVVCCASDNNATVDGASTFHTVQCSKSNVWTRHGEYTETDGASDDGTVVSIWGCKVETELLTTDTITLTLGASKSDKIITCFEATVGTGKTLALEQLGVGQGAISATVTGMTSREYLLVGAMSSEGEDSAKTPDADYTEQFDLITSTSGALDVNQAIHVQTRIATLTGDTCTSTAWTFTNAMALLAALYEVNYNSKIVGTSSGTSTTSATGRLRIPTNYTYSRSITIDNTKVAANLTDFPILVSGTYSYLATTANGGKVENANGYDIAFFENSDCDIALKFEIERWNATTGEFIAWVRVPNLADSVDTVIYMAYGDATISTAQETPSDVWESNFKGVWHLPNGASLTALDSTSSNFDGAVTGAVASTGKIDGSASFDGTGDYITHGNVLDQTGANPMTFSCWFKTSTTGAGVRTLISKMLSGSPHTGYQFGLNIITGLSADAGKLGLVLVDNNATLLLIRRQSASAYNDGNWHYAVATYDGSKNRSGINIYVDGALQTMEDSGNTAITASITNSSTFDIGARANTQQLFIGDIDEPRFAQTERATSWIETEYNNQNSPSTFYTVGSEVGGNPGAMAATSAGTSTTSAVIRAKGTLSTSTNATSTTSAVISTVHYYIDGSTSGSATTSAAIVAKGSLSASINATSTTSGTILSDGILSGSISGSTSTLGALQAKGTLAASISGTATVIGAMDTTLSGTSAGTSTTSATIRAKGSLSTSITATATTSGTLSSFAYAIGTSTATSTVSATITAKGQLVVSISPNATTTAVIRAKGELIGSASGTSTATIAPDLRMFGTSTGTATVSATIRAKGTLSGSISGTSTAIMTGSGSMVGNITGTATTSGRIKGKAKGTTSIQGQATTSATITGRTALSGTANGQATTALYTNNQTGNFFLFFS